MKGLSYGDRPMAGFACVATRSAPTTSDSCSGAPAYFTPRSTFLGKEYLLESDMTSRSQDPVQFALE